jgi:hypothetical protein
MADVKQFNIDGTVYDVKDATARSSVNTLAGSINTALSNFAPAFNSSTSYSVGDMCTRGGVLYSCTTSHTGTWNASHFEETDVESVTDNLSSEVNAIVNVYGSKNLLPIELTSITDHGLTIKSNSGVITINGDYSGGGDAIQLGVIYLKAGNYILSGAAHNLSYAYGLQFQLTDYPVTTEIAVNRTDEETSVVIPSDGNYCLRLLEAVGASTQSNDVVCYPMLRDARIKDDTFVPYAPTNKTLNETKVSWEDNSILGAKNLLECQTETTVINGITFTVNADGSVTVNGTSNNQAEFHFCTLSLPKGEYIYTDGVQGATDSTYFMNIAWNLPTSGNKNILSSRQPCPIFSDNNDTITVWTIYVRYNQTVNNLTFKPMLRLASDTDATYQPYAKTNYQLTNSTRRTRRDITNNLANLSTAVATQDLGAYGYAIGDYFTGASGYTYILADLNTFYGTSTPYCINANHLGIVVDTHATSAWQSSGDASSTGYAGSTLHSYLSGTVLDNIKSDFTALFGGWSEHLLSHKKLFTTALAGWAWSASQYISALTCTQVDVGSQWTANGFQEGEASKSLELFRKYKWTEIYGNEYPWLRNLSNYSGGAYACNLSDDGNLGGSYGVANGFFVFGLIIFH